MNDLSNAPAPQRQRKPDWIRVKAPTSKGYGETRQLMRDLNLNTVCEEAACPNIGECWTKKHATVMILGDVCTRACAFCNVKTGMPRAVDPLEPEHVAIAAAKLGLEHIVITSVDRDDLPDGGAQVFADTLRELRRRKPGIGLELLTPDFQQCQDAAIDTILSAASPLVWGHNVETVPRLYHTVRKGSKYQRSLQLLEKVARQPGVEAKSSLMLGLGESRAEVLDVLRDLRAIGVQRVSLGQYLRPTRQHLPVQEYVTPEAFNSYEQDARSLGFSWVKAGALVRSSYHAEESQKNTLPPL